MKFYCGLLIIHISLFGIVADADGCSGNDSNCPRTLICENNKCVDPMAEVQLGLGAIYFGNQLNKKISDTNASLGFVNWDQAFSNSHGKCLWALNFAYSKAKLPSHFLISNGSLIVDKFDGTEKTIFSEQGAEKSRECLAITQTKAKNRLTEFQQL